MRYILLLILLIPGALLGQEQFDLVLRGGRLIDPKNKVDAVMDVAIKDGRIARIAPRIDAPARARADVSGLLVVPGLVDMHVHVFTGTGRRGSYSGGDNSVPPDSHGPKACSTTMVDAGSSGWSNFGEFRDKIIAGSNTRVLAFLNIVGRGMAGGKIEQNTEDMDPRATAAVIASNRHYLVGVKTAHYSGPDWTAVDRAVEAGKLSDTPVMVDFGSYPPSRPHEDLVLQHLRPGDIFTHLYMRLVPMLDQQKKLRPYLIEARKRGVILDAGHGAGSFVFRQAVPATQQGLFPDTISTDLHIRSMNAGMLDMTNVMSKFLNLGMSLPDVIEASTWRPAQVIRRTELGHLTQGAPADIAVLRFEKGSFGFKDSEGWAMKGGQRLACEMTVLGGNVLYDLNARASAPLQ